MVGVLLRPEVLQLQWEHGKGQDDGRKMRTRYGCQLLVPCIGSACKIMIAHGIT